MDLRRNNGLTFRFDEGLVGAVDEVADSPSLSAVVCGDEGEVGVARGGVATDGALVGAVTVIEGAGVPYLSSIRWSES